MIDHDKMNLADPVSVGHSAMSVIDALQDFPAEIQSLGMATTFLLFCERFGLRPNEVFLTAQNVMNGVAGKRPEFEAVESYLVGEL